MAVPVSHTALVRAVLLLLSAGVLLDGLTAELADRHSIRRRMAAQMGFDGIGRNLKDIRNALVSVTLKSKVFDLVLGVQSHDISFLPGRAGKISGTFQIGKRPGASCEFSHKF